MEKTIIGRVTATERQPTTCTALSFWVHRDIVIRPFDIVRIEHISKVVGKPSYSYAIIQDLEYITDSAGHLANYVSADFGDVDSVPQNERLGSTIAHAEILYNDQEIEMPVRDGASVEWADVEGIKKALGLADFHHPISAGYIKISSGCEVPIEFESDYLLGPEGAHLNIAGISGLATKTSYVMFLLNSIQQKLSDQVSIIIFNVKGSDLLSIDELNPELTDIQKDEWIKCGLGPVPFHDVTYMYPYTNRPNNGFTTSHVSPDILAKQQSENRAFNYFYDIDTAKSKLSFLFGDIDDPSATMESIASSIKEDTSIHSWAELRSFVDQNKRSSGNKEILVASWRKFSRLLSARTQNDLLTEKLTTNIEKRRQKLIQDQVRDLRPGKVLVIDIEPLPDYLQCLVFGDVIKTVYDIKLGADESVMPNDLGKVVIFADELNKYAPKAGDTARTLTNNILEVTERGRSLGTVMFGAEQFRSGVHDRVLGNCSTNVYGRTSPVEIAKCADYKYFPDSYKSTITRLPKGSLLLQHAVFKTSLIKVQFPFPSYLQPKGS